MSNVDAGGFQPDDVDALKEEEKRKLDVFGDVQKPDALKREQKAAAARMPAASRRSQDGGRGRNLGWLLVIAGMLLLFADVSGANIWGWWWLIFLVKPLFWGGWCGGKRSC